MKHTGVMLAISVALLGGCQTQPETTTAVVECNQQCQAEQFEQLSERMINELWQLSPEWAIYQGKYEFAAKLTLPNQQQRQRTQAFVDKWRLALTNVDDGVLAASQQTDKALLLNIVNSMEWEQSRFKSWQWNPSQYNVGGVFGRILSEQWGTEQQVLQAVLARMLDVPEYYAVARTNIDNPTKQHTELAILQNKGSLAVFSQELLTRAKQSSLSVDDKINFEQRYFETRQAILSYISFLEQTLANMDAKPARSFRIGESLYEEKFSFDIQAGMSANQLYTKALADKDRAQQQMVKITTELWSKYFTTAMPNNKLVAVRQLIDHLSAQHVQRDNFVEEVRQQIPELVNFVNEKDLLTLDPTKPLIVRETPEYMRGFAGASISAPGPYDNGGNTYYNVTPLDNMGDEEAESYLREYNHWVLQILNIHEAIPGHYTQLVYSNNESSSLVKSLFGNGAMVEGWAVYAERVMLEQGYGDFEPELWLMYWKWNLRVICNTILDYSIHVLDMNEAEALDLLVNQAFQQQTEASQKWRRATLSQVQLTSYYSGFREIYDLREEQKLNKGEAFDLKDFHQQFLSYGSAPVKQIRGLMMSQQ
ncbi:DUF885 domain-containing protein [Ferrimonas lipolytica]|uniref:DUF885 domain-containing protein n=1 Tax=Ferrimonas lipolytica TaxID=2724191 RepID=A0A6H1UAK2_9GAMM|nr:DUF885 domain-containing protein [Ferrimonas lipolytica]QIZ76064.1 DUF885 domain-containing protein [Ferrimonas lipolytica]